MPISGTYLTVSEAAEKLNLSNNRVCRFCREGRFENAKKIDKIWLIPPEDLKTLKRKNVGAPTNLSKIINIKNQFLAQSAIQALENS